MLIIFDNLRSNIENKMGEEVYLSGYPFYVLQKELDYENVSSPEVITERYLQKTRQKLTAGLSAKHEWRPECEVLAWKAAVLRELIKFYYTEWETLLDLDLLKPALFSDGSDCVLLESVCDRVGLDPTKLYSELKEIKFMLLLIKARVNSLVIDTERFHKTRNYLLNENPCNEFINRRIEQEESRLQFTEYLTIISGAREKIDVMLPVLDPLEKNTLGNVLFLLEKISTTFRLFLHRKFSLDHLETINDWMQKITGYPEIGLLPTKGLVDQFNSTCRSILHKMSVVIKLMVAETINNEDVFGKRSDIIAEFIPEAFDEEAEKVLLESKFKHRKM